ncbi:P-loop containing nucleoside triphosphate hydrolase protein [Pseudoneurospora amorphoporcata]|uniref:P-loop containing nucleoside triphosphate hydrolase protein n=1 Tax=Pseudoneurospora amorphoporcata TaxID=241081 RepID=A0AAN6SCA5_9PEZI|nr:P-loop containing nucleoside triphosphate hydrolase protein [Pseudoneurospora amorphoporcata]
MVSFQSGALSKLCSKDQQELLDAIDRLRLEGINNYVSLPQIIVCGDQSSGKSSVLEAISGVAFPIKANLCTRFPTEVVLRRTLDISAHVSIVPHEDAQAAERKALSGFEEKMTSFDLLPDIIEKAKNYMGISTTQGKAFSNHRLRVEITGPDRPHLTIVDLPGLIHSETKNQTAADVQLIQNVVWSYMKQPRSIILAVVSAKNDFANQVVLKLARAADPRGHRTLGIITKPDTLHPGSESEKQYVDLAKNQEVEFRLGWHVLRNKDSDKEAKNDVDRDTMEQQFFSQGAWTELPLAHLGIDKLRERLSKVLLKQIASELPSVMQEIETKFEACNAQIQKLGDPRAKEAEQRLYLYTLSQYFQSLVKAAVDGTYNHDFFKDAKTDTGYRQRIRAVVQNLNENFADEIASRGHHYAIETYHSSVVGDQMVSISEEKFIEHIENLLKRTKGRELPGTFNPMIVSDLFLEQARPWGDLARQHVQKAWEAANQFLELIIAYIADASTLKSLKKEIFGPYMDEILTDMMDKASELLTPHQIGHPITYNQSFTEALHIAREEQSKKRLEKAVRSFFGSACAETIIQHPKSGYCSGCGQTHSGGTNIKELVDALAGTEPNPQRFGAHEALSCLNAYYTVAMKRFIDDMAAQVIEDKLVDALASILSPVTIFEMDSKQIAIIAGESEDSRIEREQLTKQLTVLQKGMDTCKRFTGMKFTGNSLFVSATSEADSTSGAQKTLGPFGGAVKRKAKAKKDEKKQPQNTEVQLLKPPSSL